VRNSGDLADLCSAAQTDPLYTAAVNFCQAFVLGVFRVLQEEEAAGPRVHMFCPTNPMPTRSEAVASFVQWVRVDPSRSTLSGTDGVAAFLAQRYPAPLARKRTRLHGHVVPRDRALWSQPRQKPVASVNADCKCRPFPSARPCCPERG
jgi:hypothetical protein